MSENHDLRVKIDATAAQRGSREFVAAVRAMKDAVKVLERDANGAFTNLNKSLERLQKASKMRFQGIDRSALNTLEAFAKKQNQLATGLTETRKKTIALRDSMKTLATGYGKATQAAATLNTTVGKGNQALKHQIDLVHKLKAAYAGMPKQATTAAPNAPRGGTGGSRASRSNTDAENRALQQQEVLRNRIIRSIDNQRAATTSLMAQLAKVGGGAEITKLANAFNRFETELNRSGVSAKDFDNAITALNHAQKTSKVAFTRLNAQVQENKNELAQAASAAREQAKAFAEMAKAADMAARAQSANGREAKRNEALTLQVSRAQRAAAVQAQQLGERMRNVGNTDGYARLEAAQRRFSQSISGGVKSALDLQKAQDRYEQELHQIVVALVRAEGAQRRFNSAQRAAAAEQRQFITNARMIEREMRSQAGAANATGQAYRKMTGNMRGLENAFNATYQAGTIFRAMLGSLTFGTFISSVYAAGTALEQFRVTMEIAAGSVTGANAAEDFINSLADRFGTNLRTAREDFAKFAVASELAGVSMQESQEIFESVSMALSVMGRSSEDQRLAFLALEQMMSKNTVSSEELRRQLGERLPGAVSLMARAVGVTTSELQDMLKAGELVSSEVMPAFADEINKAFGPGMQAATKRASRNVGTFTNELEKRLSDVADSGFMDVLAAEFAKLTDVMRSDEMVEIAQEIGHQLGTLAQVGSVALEWLVENIESVRMAVVQLGIGFLAMKSAQFFGFIATASQQFLAFTANLLQGRSQQAQAVLTTNEHSAALAANTQAARANGAAHSANAIALANVSKARAADMATLVANQSRVETGSTRASAAVGRLAGAMGLLGRAMGVAAPLLTVAALGLSAITLMSSDTAEAVNTMERDIEGALRRTGAYFKDFSNAAEQSATAVNISRAIADIAAADAALATYQQRNKDSLAALNALAVEAANAPILIPFDARQIDDLVQSLGLGEDALKGFSQTTKNMIGEAWELLTAALNNPVTASQSLNVIDDMVGRNDQAVPALTLIRTELERIAQLNFARTEGGVQATLMGFGESVTLVNNLRTLASEAIDDRSLLGSFREEADRIAKEAPNAVAMVNQLRTALTKTLTTGASSTSFLEDTAGVLTAPEVERAAAAARNLSQVTREYAAAKTEAMSGIARMEGVLSGLGSGVNSGTTDFYASQLKPLFEQFYELNALAVVTKEQLNDAFAGVGDGSNDFQRFMESTLLLFGSIDEEAQNYKALVDITNALVESMAAGGADVTGFADAMLENARGAASASITFSQLRRETLEALESMGAPASIVEAVSAAFLDTAQSAERMAIEQGKATREVDESQDVLKAATESTHRYSEAMALLASNFELIQSAMDGVRETGAELIAAANERLMESGRDQKLSQMAPWMRDATEEFWEARDALDESHKARQQSLMERFDPRTDPQIFADLQRQYERHLQELARIRDAEIAAARQAHDTPTWEDQHGPQAIAQRQRAADEMRRRGLQEQQDALETQNELLEEQLTLAEEAASVYVRLAEARYSHLDGLNRENGALMLLLDGQASSMEHAEMLADAMSTGHGATIEQTRAFIEQAEAAELLNRKLSILAADPVKEWVDSVPTWLEAGRELETKVFDSLSDTLADFMKTGELSFRSLAQSIIGTAADILADIAVREMMALFGVAGTGGERAGFGLGEWLQKKFGHSAGSVFDPANGGMPNVQTGDAISQQLARQNSSLQTQRDGQIAGINQSFGVTGLQAAVAANQQTTTAIQSAIQNVGQATGDIMGYASQFLGMHEQTNNANLQSLLSVDPAVTAWCADFVNSVLGKNGMTGTGSNMAQSFLNWGQDASANPQIGDIAVFGRGGPESGLGHVGFISGFNEDGSLQILGGNQSNKVTETTMSTDRLLGVRTAPGMSAGAGSVAGAASPLAGGAHNCCCSGGMGGGALQTESQQAGQVIQQSIQQGGEMAGQSISQSVQTGATQSGQRMSQQMAQGGTMAATQMTAGIQQGGTMAGQAAQSGVTQGGTAAAGSIQAALTQGGASAAAQIGAAASMSGTPPFLPGAVPTGGGGFMGGFGGTLLMMAGTTLLGGLLNGSGSKNNGYKPPEPYHVPTGSAFSSPDSPAILRSSPAMAPAPVAASAAPTITFGDISVTVEKRGDNETDEEVSARMAKTLTDSVSLMIDQKFADHVSYGGMLNPRGGRR